MPARDCGPPASRGRAAAPRYHMISVIISIIIIISTNIVTIVLLLLAII